MGGQQSGESPEQHEHEETQRKETSEETPGELPQCMMGDKKVDDMCFMISCTNWY